MAINYAVKATIVDILSDTPRERDAFVIDTNVWYWLFYNPAPPPSNQDRDYISYIAKARSAKSLLAYSGFSLAELAHLIEKEEREIFNSSLPSPAPVKPKEYRHNYPAERVNVVAQVQAVWSQVKAIAAPINLTIDESTTDEALSRFGAEPLDGYDLFILETMKKEGIVNIITDDGDFCTVTGITVFTANKNVINAARSQGQLVVR